MTFKHRISERAEYLSKMGLTIKLDDIASGSIKVFGFLILNAPREREVWALLEQGPAKYVAAEGIVKSGKALDPVPDQAELSAISKRFGVEVWELALEIRPRIK